MAQSMDDILSGETETIEEIVVEEQPTGEKEKEAAPESDVQEDKEEPAAEESSPDPDKSETHVPLSVVHGERDRRQAAEKRAAELESKLEETQKTPPTSVFEDEAKFVDEFAGNVDQKLTNFALNQSEFFARREFGSVAVDEKIEKFKALVADNPTLKERFANSVSPYHELVEIVDQHDELDKMSDLDSYRAQIRAEERAKLKEEMEQEAKGKKKLRESIPDSLAGDTSEGGLTSSDWSGPPSMDDILK